MIYCVSLNVSIQSLDFFYNRRKINKVKFSVQFVMCISFFKQFSYVADIMKNKKINDVFSNLVS